MFVFASDPREPRSVLPVRYSDILHHVAARRRHSVEGLNEQHMNEIRLFLEKRNPCPSQAA